MSYKDPLTGLTIPITYFNSDTLVSPIKYVDLYSLVKPLSIDGTDISHIDHMWITQNIFPNGNIPDPSTMLLLEGHLKSYTRGDDTNDYCFEPICAAEIL